MTDQNRDRGAEKLLGNIHNNQKVTNSRALEAVVTDQVDQEELGKKVELIIAHAEQAAIDDKSMYADMDNNLMNRQTIFNEVMQLIAQAHKGYEPEAQVKSAYQRGFKAGIASDADGSHKCDRCLYRTNAAYAMKSHKEFGCVFPVVNLELTPAYTQADIDRAIMHGKGVLAAEMLKRIPSPKLDSEILDRLEYLRDTFATPPHNTKPEEQ